MLPPNSTALERAISGAISVSDELGVAAELPRDMQVNPPENILPWLASEWFLSDFTRYFPDNRSLVSAGLPWLKVRGTAAAVKMALAWIQFSASLEEDGARLQLDPGTAEAPANLAEIKHLVESSIPAHVQFYRMYHGYDLRLLKASCGQHWDDGLLSDDSGVWVDGVKLSFGRTHAGATDLEVESSEASLERLHSSHVLYPDVLRWGVACFGDQPVINHPVIHGQLIGLSTKDPLLDPVTLSGHSRVAKASLRLSDDSMLGDINTRFGGYLEIQTNVFFWSDPDSRMSDFDAGMIRQPIEEVFLAVHGIHTDLPMDFCSSQIQSTATRIHTNPTEPAPQLTEFSGDGTMTRVHSSESIIAIGDRSSSYSWTGPWDSRRWTGDIGTSHNTLTT